MGNFVIFHNHSFLKKRQQIISNTTFYFIGTSKSISKFHIGMCIKWLKTLLPCCNFKMHKNNSVIFILITFLMQSKIIFYVYSLTSDNIKNVYTNISLLKKSQVSYNTDVTFFPNNIITRHPREHLNASRAVFLNKNKNTWSQPHV